MSRDNGVAYSISKLKAQRRISWIACIVSITALFAATILFVSRVSSNNIAAFFLVAFIATSLVTAFMTMFFAFTRSDYIDSAETQSDMEQP